MQVGKADVVADRHADFREPGIGQNRTITRPVASGFAICLGFGHLNIEHVDLVIPGADRPIRADQERAIGETPVRVLRLEGQRSDQQPHTQFSRFGAQRIEGWIIVLIHEHCGLVRAAGGHAIGHLGGQNESRALPRRLSHHVPHHLDVGVRIIA